MKRIQWVVAAFGLIACIHVLSCTPAGAPILGDVGSGSDTGDQSVGDVTNDQQDDGASVPTPSAAVRARVRNESSARADVTLRFVRDSKIVHLAFLRVLPDTITTVTSPESVERVELSGVDDRGQAIDGAVFVFGVDFTESVPAEYTLLDDVVDPTPVHPVPVDPISPSPNPPRVTLTEPSEEITVSLGGTFAARWTDSGGSDGALVTLYLQAADVESAERFAVGPGVGAALDGINDGLIVVVQDLDPGLYELVAVTVDGSRTSTSIARGRVRVVQDPDNAAPSIEVRLPFAGIPLRAGDLLNVAWDDVDPDDNATITLELTTSDRTDAGAFTFAIAPPIAENPDGSAADSATVAIRGALPGVYDLVATIDDGQLIGTDRVERAVHVLAEPNNDPPQLTMREPATDTDVATGRALFVRWEDSDANDDARISLLLDPDLENVPLDGDELLLAASLGEDADGNGDSITLGIPLGTARGDYRLVAVISDGLTQLLTSASGVVRIDQTTAQPPDDNDNTDDNGNDNDDGGGGGGIIVPPPLPTPDPWVVTPIVGIDEIVALPSEPVTIVVESDVLNGPGRDRSRIYLNNRAYGGDLRTDATPLDFPPPDDGGRTFDVQLRTEAVPNRAWPRKFDVEVETTVDGETEVIIGSRPVWIRQGVEVMGVVLSGGVTCVPPNIDANSLLRLDITWYGGGVDDQAMSQLDVQFWLSGDGLVPSGDGDALHRVIAVLPASPNVIRSASINLGEALSGQADDEPGGSRISPTLPLLMSGAYSIVTVTDPNGAVPTVAAPFASGISVCGPARDEGARQP